MVSIEIRRNSKKPGWLDHIKQLWTGPKRVKVGFPKGEASSDVVARATYNEFGTTHIPERPFMRNAMRANRSNYADMCRRAAQRIISGDMTMRKALELLGTKAQGDIQREIVALNSPPNAPSTIKRKGSSNPLIDTGEMRQSVTHKVDE